MKPVAILRRFSSALFMMILTNAGCQDSGESFVLAPVEGRVVLDSNPVPDALVQFSPTKGPSSQGYTDSSGQFTLMANAGKGAVVGPHSVKVTTGLPRPVEANAATTNEPPKEVPLGNSPPTDYVFETTISVENNNNVIELDLSKAKKRRG